ncbi:hypothetical protein [Alteromonas sp. CYL-A6]
MTKHRQSDARSGRLRFWHTDCPVCQRIRLYIIWAVLMFLVYWYVF